MFIPFYTANCRESVGPEEVQQRVLVALRAEVALGRAEATESTISDRLVVVAPTVPRQQVHDAIQTLVGVGRLIEVAKSVYRIPTRFFTRKPT